MVHPDFAVLFGLFLIVDGGEFEHEAFLGAVLVEQLRAFVLAAHGDASGNVRGLDGGFHLVDVLPAVAAAAGSLVADVLLVDGDGVGIGEEVDAHEPVFAFVERAVRVLCTNPQHGALPLRLHRAQPDCIEFGGQCRRHQAVAMRVVRLIIDHLEVWKLFHQFACHEHHAACTFHGSAPAGDLDVSFHYLSELGLVNCEQRVIGELFPITVFEVGK